MKKTATFLFAVGELIGIPMNRLIRIMTLALALGTVLTLSSQASAEHMRSDGRGGYYTHDGHIRSDGRGGFYTHDGHIRSDGRGGFYTPDGHVRSDGRGGYYTHDGHIRSDGWGGFYLPE